MRMVVLFLLLATAAHATEEPRSDLIRFRIKDQHGALHTDARYRNAPLLVFWGDKRGSEHLGNWSPVLRDSLAHELGGYRLRAVDVAHTEGAPFFVKGMIRKKVREGGDSPVLLDWDGAFARAYGCREKHANILFFDREARLTRTWAVTDADATVLGEILVMVRRAAAQRVPADR